MKSTRFFIIFTFLLAFALQVSAQNDSISIPKGIDFNDLLKIGPKKVKNLELGFSTPNELEGYEFFSNGKLIKLKIGISTEENVKTILGTACKEFCNYDSNWKIQFEYFDEKTSYVTESYNGNGNKIGVKKFATLPEYFGKIRSIKFIPQNNVSFSAIAFSNNFYKSSSVAFGDDFSGNSVSVSIDSYTDGYGLRYTIFDKINYSAIKNKDTSLKSDLISIEYTIPKDLEEKMFVEQK